LISFTIEYSLSNVPSLSLIAFGLTPVIRTGSAVVKDERSGMDVTMGTVVEAEVIAE